MEDIRLDFHSMADACRRLCHARGRNCRCTTRQAWVTLHYFVTLRFKATPRRPRRASRKAILLHKGMWPATRATLPASSPTRRRLTPRTNRVTLRRGRQGTPHSSPSATRHIRRGCRHICRSRCSLRACSSNHSRCRLRRSQRSSRPRRSTRRRRNSSCSSSWACRRRMGLRLRAIRRQAESATHHKLQGTAQSSTAARRAMAYSMARFRHKVWRRRGTRSRVLTHICSTRLRRQGSWPTAGTRAATPPRPRCSRPHLCMRWTTPARNLALRPLRTAHARRRAFRSLQTASLVPSMHPRRSRLPKATRQRAPSLRTRGRQRRRAQTGTLALRPTQRLRCRRLGLGTTRSTSTWSGSSPRCRCTRSPCPRPHRSSHPLRQPTTPSPASGRQSRSARRRPPLAAARLAMPARCRKPLRIGKCHKNPCFRRPGLVLGLLLFGTPSTMRQRRAWSMALSAGRMEPSRRSPAGPGRIPLRPFHLVAPFIPSRALSPHRFFMRPPSSLYGCLTIPRVP
mmetsp:Transcript_88067/g.247564  ORF Transcript_88067/g.247564 Transcript_88067/m.247564 type:complete len:512 (+) Transcript_88067:1066-2601(+)